MGKLFFLYLVISLSCIRKSEQQKCAMKEASLPFGMSEENTNQCICDGKVIKSCTINSPKDTNDQVGVFQLYALDADYFSDSFEISGNPPSFLNVTFQKVALTETNIFAAALAKFMSYGVFSVQFMGSDLDYFNASEISNLYSRLLLESPLLAYFELINCFKKAKRGDILTITPQKETFFIALKFSQLHNVALKLPNPFITPYYGMISFQIESTNFYQDEFNLVLPFETKTINNIYWKAQEFYPRFFDTASKTSSTAANSVYFEGGPSILTKETFLFTKTIYNFLFDDHVERIEYGALTNADKSAKFRLAAANETFGLPFTMEDQKSFDEGNCNDMGRGTNDTKQKLFLCAACFMHQYGLNRTNDEVDGFCKNGTKPAGSMQKCYWTEPSALVPVPMQPKGVHNETVYSYIYKNEEYKTGVAEIEPGIGVCQPYINPDYTPTTQITTQTETKTTKENDSTTNGVTTTSVNISYVTTETTTNVVNVTDVHEPGVAQAGIGFEFLPAQNSYKMCPSSMLILAGVISKGAELVAEL